MEEKKEIFSCAKREDWRAWLAAHYREKKEIWFVFPKLASTEPGVSYNDAVEEALCFGWIDGRAGTLDELHALRRFTPRIKGSAYSRMNIERLIRLEGRGMLLPEVREEVLPLITAPYVFPEDILREIEKDPAVRERFETFSPAYKRIRVAYIEAARHRPAEFEKRLENFIEKTREGKLITGYGGIEEYYK